MMPDTLFTFVVCCFVCAAAQFNGIQNFQLNGGRTNLDQPQRQLSPQQQGHILSDIQQHQHRFQLHQNLLKAQEQQKTINFGPQNVFQQPFANQQGLNPTSQFGGSAVSAPDHPDAILQPQLPLVHQNHQFNSHTNGQPSLLNPQFLSQPPQSNLQTLTSSVATPLAANQFLSPTQSSANLQQGGFQNNFLQQPVQIQPTSNPVNVITNNPQPANPVITNEQNNFFDSSEAHQQRLKDLRLKQQIIDKHNQFVEKQYEKALKKAQDDHQEWLDTQREQRKKLYQSLYRPGGPRILNYSGPRPRLIFPEESSLFQQAVDKYYEEHPTTTTTTTTTTTEAPTTKTIATTRRSKKLDLSEDDEDPELFLPSNRQSLFGELKSAVQRDIEPGNKEQFLPTAIPEAKAKPIKSIEQLDLLQKQYQQQLLQREDLLAQLRKAIAETPEEDNANKNFTSREISLPNGQTVQIIKTTDPKLIPGATPLTSESIATPKVVKATTPPSTTTAKPPKALLEELTQGVLPPGADFEVIKHDPNGGLQELGNLPTNLPNQKKVTFVLLEEQQDGSYKVQGVKGNANDKSEKESVDVDSILNKIKTGELKLPPPTRTTISNEVTSTPYSIKDIKAQSTAYPTPSQASRSTISFQSTNSVSPKPQVQILTNSNPDSVISSSNNGKQFVPSSTQTTYKSSSALPYSQKYPSTTPTTLPSSKFLPQQALLPTIQTKFQSQPPFFPSSTEQVRLASPTINAQKNSFPVLYASSTLRPNPPKPTPQSAVTILQSQPSSVLPLSTDSTAFADNDYTFATTQANMPLTDLFKKKGLFAMSKFLKQSGLDTILNETGPYTIFVPSDKAFKNLLIQLGGPEKAEEKFKENPRLLSGLLLHHVIPGAFEIKHLQDEMTGVSLAGTQLRVNQYAMQDVEWNEVKVTTINGAKVMDDKQDIPIPQGIAHTVDRVMFPLPVGDIVQTLQSDRERRFTTFLRILFASGLVDTLQGTKTFTVFAPVDRAFTSLSTEQLSHIVTDRAAAREFIMKHIIPGTLYTSGMRYYQIKDSLQPDKQITINKTSGRIKVNNVNIITQNVPTTNGVIHAMESLL